MKINVSRSKLEQYLQCPRCGYLDIIMNTPRPPGYPFTLNNAVDRLWKIEMDTYRRLQKPHPLAVDNALDLVPFDHKDIDNWRNTRKGLQTTYRGLHLKGVLDDVWADQKKKLFVVDQKATAKAEPVTALTSEAHHNAYRRQIEFYQWLLYKNDFDVDPTGFFIYSTGDNGRKSFEDTLHFTTKLIPYTGDFSWVEPALDRLMECIESGKVPEPSSDCSYCRWIAKVNTLTADPSGLILLPEAQHLHHH